MATNKKRVAIIGATGIFPGANSLDCLDKLLSKGYDAIRPIPEERALIDNLSTSDFPEMAYLDRIDLFDPSYYKLSPNEAKLMDPHHRIALDLTRRAISNSGYTIKELSKLRPGVLFASYTSEYYRRIDFESPIIRTGNRAALLAGRISYTFDFKGPCFMIDTACSSSLAAIHQACQMIGNEEVDVALVGGVSLQTLTKREELPFDQDPLGLRAKDGRSKAFDEKADGIGIGEGGGVFVLKPFIQAQQDNDRILCVIEGSALNHDGNRSNGLTAPSPEAQTDVLIDAWRKAEIDANKLTYIEAHGTGTKLGDPIELQAIDNALHKYAVNPNNCSVGSIKSNIGHLGGAAGIASLSKVILSCHFQKLYPSIHVSQPTSFFEWSKSPLYYQSELTKVSKTPFYAGVSSFGLSGTNVHIVLSSVQSNDVTKIEKQITQYDLESYWIKSKDSKSEKQNCNTDDALAVAETKEKSICNKEVINIVIEIFNETLGIDSVKPKDDFFMLGGNSMLGSFVANKIEERIGIEFLAEDLWDYSTAEMISSFVQKSFLNQTNSDNLNEPSEPQLLVPSDAQYRMWVLRKLNAHPLIGVDFSLFRIKGDINIKVLRDALQKILTSHSAFKQRFKEIKGELKTYFKEKQDSNIEFLDFNTRIENDYDLFEQNKIKELINNPPALEDDIPLKLIFIKKSSSEVMLLMAVQHIIFDGWSKVLFKQHLLQLYEQYLSGKGDLQSISSNYEKYLKWNTIQDNKAKLDKQIEYWRNHLPENPPPFPIPTDQFPANRSLEGNRYILDIQEDLVELIKKFCSETKSTPFSVLVFVLACVIHRFSKQESLIIGTPVATRKTREWRKTIGLFLNTVALAFELKAGVSAKELFLKHKNIISKAFKNKDVPYNDVLTAIRVKNNQPLFEILFDYHNQADAIQYRNSTKLKLEYNPIFSGIVQHALEFTIKAVDDKKWQCLIDYQTSLFKSEEIYRLANQFIIFLQEFLSNPDIPLERISLIDKKERNRLLFTLNETTVKLDTQNSFINLFRLQVSKSPESIACRNDHKDICYSDLWKNSSQLADQMKFQGVQEGDIIAVEMKRGEFLLTSILAIFQCYAVYLPISPEDPSERRLAILNQAKCKFCLCTKKTDIDDYWINYQESFAPYRLYFKKNNKKDRIEEYQDQLSYVIFTSGSTGKPKGVIVKEVGMLNHLFAKISDLDMTSNDVVIQNASQSFDISIWQMLAPLIVGGRVRFIDNDTAKDPISIFKLICKEHISIVEVVPSLLRAFIEMLDPDKENKLQNSSLRYMISTGEALPIDICNLWAMKFKEIPLVNAYGPTECSDDVTHFFIYKPLPDGYLRVPVGKPIQNTQIYILDENRDLLPQGAIGEIYVGGKGVGAGYLNEPGLTAKAFISEKNITGREGTIYKTGDIGRIRNDGTIDYFGRLDDQIKIRGNRIELEEIKSELIKLPEITDAAVITQDFDEGIFNIFAFISVDNDLKISTNDLKRNLQKKLPSYMLPKEIISVKSLPKTRNGKIDKQKLKVILGNNSAKFNSYIPEHNEHNIPNNINSDEQELLKICQNVLKNDNLSVTDNLIQHGANSLDMIRIAAQASQLGYYFSIKQIISSPYIYQLSSFKNKNEQKNVSSHSALLNENKLKLTPMQDWFFKLNLKYPHYWNKIRFIKIKKDLSDLHIFQVGQLITNKHNILKTGFRRKGNKWENFLIEQTLPVPYEVVRNTSTHSTLTEDMQKRIKIAHNTFSLDVPPLLKFIRLHNYTSDSDLLCLIAHHLICDGISLDVLQQDIEIISNQIIDKKNVKLLNDPIPSYSKMRSMKKSSTTIKHVNVEQEYDLEELRLHYKKNLEKDCKEKITLFSNDLDGVNTLVDNNPIDLESLLISGLLKSLYEVFKWPFIIIDIGHHGRGEGNDNWSKIGWFSTFSPILFQVDSQMNFLKKVDEIQQVIYESRAQGNLNLQCSEIKNYCPNNVSGWVSFDFVGTHTNRNQIFPDVSRQLKHPENTRPYLLEVIAKVNNETLEILLKYPGKVYSKAQMNELMQLFIKKSI